MSKLMMCGHTANVVDMKTGNPVCVICLGINEGATIVNPNPPSLEGRVAVCTYCNRQQPSAVGLAFFEHSPGQHDAYYCGCKGWN